MKSFKQFINEVKKPTGDLKKSCWKGYTAVGMKMKNGRKVPNCVPEEVRIGEDAENEKKIEKKVDKLTDLVKKHVAKEEVEPIDEFIVKSGSKYTVKSEKGKNLGSYSSRGAAKKRLRQIEFFKHQKEEVEQVDETAAWKRKEGKSPTGGLNAKGVASYRKENPGSKLKMAVTGKVKPGSKAAKRRKSFCARMSGMKGPMKKPNGEPTRKALSLRKWKCRSK